jgi:hypothetical protein
MSSSLKSFISPVAPLPAAALPPATLPAATLPPAAATLGCPERE